MSAALLREAVEAIYRAAIERVEAGAAVRRVLTRADDGGLLVGDRPFDTGDSGLWVIAIGKAGCQMMAALKDLIPGAEAWPRFVKNASEQFEARLCTIEVLPGPSIFFAGMAGSRLPVATAHGEGRALFDRPEDAASVLVAGRYVDNRGHPTEVYPLNPNGSAGGLTAVTTTDGRFTAIMPHPERVFRTVQLSWAPREWGEDSPWLRFFRNARVFAG